MFEPFAGNYIWSLSVNIVLCIGGEIGELDVANREVREAAKRGADAGTEAFFYGIEHVSADNMEPCRSFIADWIAEHFYAGKRETSIRQSPAHARG